MKFVVLAFLVASAIAFAPQRDPLTIKSHAIHDYVNSIGTTWTVGEADNSLRMKLMDVKYTKRTEDVQGVAEHEDLGELPAPPATFDARSQWPACKSIGSIRDQSNCASGWAFAVAEVLSNRFCIESNGRLTPELSPEDLLSCCGSYCGGCDGGNHRNAWNYESIRVRIDQIRQLSEQCKNVVQPGSYSGCKPYSFAPCGTHVDHCETHYNNCSDSSPTPPVCSTSCTNPNYNGCSYAHDKYNGDFIGVAGIMPVIQLEILNNGPIGATIIVYEDFLSYKSGIYQHVSGKEIGGQVVKIIGWGTEKGTPYWLVANSFGSNWGESGFFRIRRDNNECGIERQTHKGWARTKSCRFGKEVVRWTSLMTKTAEPCLFFPRRYLTGRR